MSWGMTTSTALITTEMPLYLQREKLSPGELEIIGRYADRITGIPDCFGLMGEESAREPCSDDLERLVGMSKALTKWWEAIDDLDAELRGSPEGDLSRVGKLVMWHELHRWFRVRQETLQAIAHHSGASIPIPEDAKGNVRTSHSGTGPVSEGRGPVGRFRYWVPERLPEI